MLVGIAVIILDSGFDVVNPLLVDSGISPKAINFIKIGFAIYGIVRLKQSQPIRKKNRSITTN